jgi:UDP-galactopyranose mutase
VIDLADKYLKALPKNVMSFGRIGTYRYVDIDHIVLQGLKFYEDV